MQTYYRDRVDNDTVWKDILRCMCIVPVNNPAWARLYIQEVCVSEHFAAGPNAYALVS